MARAAVFVALCVALRALWKGASPASAGALFVATAAVFYEVWRTDL
jgi:hypothetical protein